MNLVNFGDILFLVFNKLKYVLDNFSERSNQAKIGKLDKIILSLKLL